MLRTSFDGLVHLIRDHSIFANKSRHKQAPVEFQLMVALQRLGHSGNSASLLSYASEYALAGESIRFHGHKNSQLRHSWRQFIYRGYRLFIFSSSLDRVAKLGGRVHQVAGCGGTYADRQGNWQLLSILQVRRFR